jgi:LytS/YehU family sensor histidine kinase
VKNKKYNVAVPVEDNKERIGLANVKKQLNLLYPSKHELIISENSDVFEVSLTLDLT